MMPASSGGADARRCAGGLGNFATERSSSIPAILSRRPLLLLQEAFLRVVLEAARRFQADRITDGSASGCLCFLNRPTDESSLNHGIFSRSRPTKHQHLTA
jgi:hypothetical protein